MPVSKLDYFTQLATMISGKVSSICLDNPGVGGACCLITENVIYLPGKDNLCQAYFHECNGQYSSVNPGRKNRDVRVNFRYPVSVYDLAKQFNMSPNETNTQLLTAWLQRMLLYHEASHIWTTQALPEQKSQELGQIGFLFYNLFEDRRIETSLAKLRFPGMKRKFDRMNRFLLSQHQENPQFKAEASIKNAYRCGMLAMMLEYGIISEKALAKYTRQKDVIKRCQTLIQDVVTRSTTISQDELFSYSLEMAKYFTSAGAPRIHPINRKPDMPADDGYKRPAKGNKTDDDDDFEDTGQAGDMPTDSDDPGQSDKEKEGQDKGKMSDNRPGKGHIDPFDPSQTSNNPIIQEMRMDLKGMLDEIEEYHIDLNLAYSTRTRCFQTCEYIKPALANRLGQQLRQLMARNITNVDKLDSEGCELDMPGYIDYMVSGDDDIKMFQNDVQDAPDFHIVFCLDRSGSMNGGPDSKLELAKSTVINLSAGCDLAKVKTSILAFDDGCDIFKKPDFATDYSQAGMINQGGGTLIIKALQVAYQMLREMPARRQAIILVSDGGDTSWPSCAKLASQNQQVEIYYLGIQCGEYWLTEFKKAGAKLMDYQDISEASQIEKALISIVQEIVQNGR